MATVILVSALAAVGLSIASVTACDSNDLEAVSGDVLNSLWHRDSTPASPNLNRALSSGSEWRSSSETLYSNIKEMIPCDVECLISTPYGQYGKVPPPGARAFSRQFQAFCIDTERVIECELTLWRA